MRIKLALLTLVIALHALVIFFLFANQNKEHEEAEVTVVRLAPTEAADSAPPSHVQASDKAETQSGRKLAAQTPSTPAPNIAVVTTKTAATSRDSGDIAPPGSAQAAAGSVATETSTGNTSATASTTPAALQLETRPASCADAPKLPYPKASRERGEEGSPTLNLYIGVNGLVQNVSLLESSGFARLDHAAIQIVKAWRCRPALDHGTPVAASTTQRVHFSLKTP